MAFGDTLIARGTRADRRGHGRVNSQSDLKRAVNGCALTCAVRPAAVESTAEMAAATAARPPRPNVPTNSHLAQRRCCPAEGKTQYKTQGTPRTSGLRARRRESRPPTRRWRARARPRAVVLRLSDGHERPCPDRRRVRGLGHGLPGEPNPPPRAHAARQGERPRAKHGDAERADRARAAGVTARTPRSPS
jgi:hypothetical protein